MSQIYCVLDYETRSEVDLKEVGAYEYSRHPTTRILCAAWRIGTRDTLRTARTRSWSPALPETAENLEHLRRAFRLPDVRLVAHNAFFEQVITAHVLLRSVPLSISRWQCTAAQAAALALPRNLEGACIALGLPVQKDMEGRRLILKYCKPRKPTKNNPAKWHNSITDLKRIIQYCETDVAAEVELLLATPELHPFERRVWELDQKINWRGFRVDRELVTTVQEMIAEESGNLLREAQEIAGLNPTQRNAVMEWLSAKGARLPDLRAKTVADALKFGAVAGEAKRFLEIRQAVSKTSTAKYAAFEARTRTDGRVRDMLVYHTASTGRWGGAGVQPQNFPRGTIKNTTEAAEVLAEGNLDWVRLLYGDPMSVFSSCLRAMIIPNEGKEFACADYATIEVRVLFWLAEHAEGLRQFSEGSDLYKHMAARIFGVPVEAVTAVMRALGKSTILGCGYGMGKKKFFQNCREQGQEVTEELAELAVRSYREEHAPVVQLWRNIEMVAIKAVLAHRRGIKRRYTVNRTTWWVENDFLFCELPSGRRLAYYKPTLKYEETPWGEPRAVLYHFGVNSTTKQWELGSTYGAKLVENITQAVARDLMAHAMVRAEERGYGVVLSVHDELLAEQERGRAKEEFERAMAELPEWAKGCPVKAEGWTGRRYRK